MVQLNIIPSVTDHTCYILKSTVSNRIYVGYTIDFNRRLRQHNGEIVGGAKKTSKYRPWVPVCTIQGFYESSAALRFEYRLQHNKIRRKAGEDAVNYILKHLNKIIISGDGSKAKNNKIPWPTLRITWINEINNNNYIDNAINIYKLSGN